MSGETRKRIGVVTEDELGLDGRVSGHFGHSLACVVVEVADGKLGAAEVVRNPSYGNHQPGQMPRFVRTLNVEVIIAGGMGPGAVQLFDAFGIEVAAGATGTVREAVEAYLRGELHGAASCGGHGGAGQAHGCGGGHGHGCGGHG